MNIRSFHALLAGSGDLYVEELHTGTFCLLQTETGDVKIDSGSAQSGSITNTGEGYTIKVGKFGNITRSNFRRGRGKNPPSRLIPQQK